MKIETIDIDGKQYNVLIGRNSADNDLVIDISEPEHIWFHFKDTSGPHIVLQCDSILVPKNILQNVGNKLYTYKKSANMNEKIMYTEIKNVRKTKVKGCVTLSTFKTLN